MTHSNPIAEALRIATALAERLERAAVPQDHWPVSAERGEPAQAARRLVEILSSIAAFEPPSNIVPDRLGVPDEDSSAVSAQPGPQSLSDSDLAALAKQAHDLMLAVADDTFGPIDCVRALSCYDSLSGEQRADLLRRVRAL